MAHSNHGHHRDAIVQIYCRDVPLPEKKAVIAKGIDELQRNEHFYIELAKSSSKVYTEMASKVYTEATKSFEDGDEERAYIFFYKYVNMYKLVRKSKELYQKDKYYYDLMMPRKNVKFSLEKVEELEKKLTEHYQENKLEKAIVENESLGVESLPLPMKNEKPVSDKGIVNIPIDVLEYMENIEKENQNYKRQIQNS